MGRNDGILNYTPHENFNGMDTMFYEVMDSGTTSGENDPKKDSAFVFIQVQPVNDPPTINTIRDQTIDEDQTLRIALETDDIDGDVLEISASLDSLFLSDSVLLYIFSDGDSLLINPVQNWYGDASITVSINDGEFTVEESFNLTVNSVDDEPQIVGYIDDIYV